MLGSQTLLLRMLGCARSNQPCLTAVPNVTWNGRYTSIEFEGLCLRNMFALRCHGKVASVIRNLFSSIDVVGHVPSSIPGILPDKFFFFQVDEAAIRMIIKKVEVSN